MRSIIDSRQVRHLAGGDALAALPPSAAWMSGPPPWAERKHRAWFLDRQRRCVLRGGVALPAVPRSQDPQHAATPRTLGTAVQPLGGWRTRFAEGAAAQGVHQYTPRAAVRRTARAAATASTPSIRRRHHVRGKLEHVVNNSGPGKPGSGDLDGGAGRPCRQWRGRTPGWTVFRLPSGVDGK